MQQLLNICLESAEKDLLPCTHFKLSFYVNKTITEISMLLNTIINHKVIHHLILLVVIYTCILLVAPCSVYPPMVSYIFI